MDFPANGEWWRPSDPTVRVSGRLDQLASGEFVFETYSGLDGDDGGGQEDFHGDASGLQVILRTPRWVSTRMFAIRAKHHETYSTKSALCGANVHSQKGFESCESRSEHLDGWVNAKMWDSPASSDSLKILPLPSETWAQLDDGLQFGLRHALKTTYGLNEWKVQRSTSIRFSSSAGNRSEKFFEELIEHLDSLVDIIFRRPTSTSSTILGSGKDSSLTYLTSPRLYGGFAEPEYSQIKFGMHPLSLALCSFDVIGVEGLASWMNMSPTLRYLAKRVTSRYRKTTRFIEDWASVAFAVGEALDRVESGFSQSTARTRWKRLASKIPEFVDDFVGIPIDDWANRVVNARDDLAHILSYELSDKRAWSLHGLASSAQFLNELTILRLAGMDTAMRAIPNSYRWQDERAEFLGITHLLP